MISEGFKNGNPQISITVFLVLLLLSLIAENSFAVTLNMSGVEISQHNDQFRVAVRKILNTDTGQDYSGTVSLKLYASKEEYIGGGINGVILSEFKFTATFAGGNKTIENLNLPMQIIYPQQGIYYVTLALEAPDGNIQYYVNMTDCFSFDTTKQEVKLVLLWRVDFNRNCSGYCFFCSQHQLNPAVFCA